MDVLYPKEEEIKESQEIAELRIKQKKSEELNDPMMAAYYSYKIIILKKGDN